MSELDSFIGVLLKAKEGLKVKEDIEQIKREAYESYRNEITRLKAEIEILKKGNHGDLGNRVFLLEQGLAKARMERGEQKHRADMLEKQIRSLGHFPALIDYKAKDMRKLKETEKREEEIQWEQRKIQNKEVTRDHNRKYRMEDRSPQSLGQATKSFLDDLDIERF